MEHNYIWLLEFRKKGNRHIIIGAYTDYRECLAAADSFDINSVSPSEGFCMTKLNLNETNRLALVEYLTKKG